MLAGQERYERVASQGEYAREEGKATLRSAANRSRNFRGRYRNRARNMNGATDLLDNSRSIQQPGALTM